MRSQAVLHKVSTASVGDIHEHLLACDKFFQPPLSDRLDIGEYAEKLKTKAQNFEAWQAERLVGLVAVYINRQSGVAFISSVSTLPGFEGKGIASGLLELAFEHSYAMGCREAALEVSRHAHGAIALYSKLGFSATTDSGESLPLKLTKSIRRSESA